MSTESGLQLVRAGHVWMAAKQFYDAAERLMTAEKEAYPLAITVNYAFACELALKSTEVITTYGASVPVVVDDEEIASAIVGAATLKSAAQGHSLDQGFKQLTTATQISLTSEFANDTGEQLRPLLERCSTYFVTARYVHEELGCAFDLHAVETLARGLLNGAMRCGGGTARVARRSSN